MAAPISRLSLRLRVTLAFTAAMAVVLAATGLFVYVQLGSTLRSSLDRGLSGRADDIAALLDQAPLEPGRRLEGPLARRSRDVAQILDGDGNVADSSSPLGAQPLLTPEELRRARTKTVRVTHPRPRLDGDGVRLLARPASSRGERYVVVVGAATEPEEDAQHDLGGLLLVGGPIALLLAAVAGYGAATGALAPVERMRRRAAAVSAGGGERLPVSDTEDELARLGRTLNAMLDRLDAAYAHERRFVSDASHELRTPLAILKGELELALRDADGVEDFRAAVMSAAEETDRLVALAEDLLVIARADQGQLPVRATVLDAGELLAGVAARFATRAAQAGVELVVDGAGARVAGDRRLLEQALGNLVDNALAHGARHVWMRAGDGALAVADDGDGFPEDFAARAFERFTRADAARGRGGAGLGLAIVAAIAEAHGASAGAANRPGGGAEVRLQWPSR